MRVTITRHGETEENIKGILQGQNPGTLSKTGIEQAIRLAERLKDDGFDAIYHSDLRRVTDTLREILKYQPGAALYERKELRERSFGSLQGMYIKEIPKIFESPQTEKTESLMARAGSVWSEIENSGYNNVLVVTHGGTMHALVANIKKIQFEDAHKLGPLDNTSVILLDPVPEVKLYNCTAHLKTSA